jgi:hypothetical protein
MPRDFVVPRIFPEKQPMDLKAIRDHLCLARLALGPDHPLASRIKTVERKLTPGDLLFRNDAVSAETELLAISTDLERLPNVKQPREEGISERAQVEVPLGVNEAIQQIGDAIELL